MESLCAGFDPSKGERCTPNWSVDLKISWKAQSLIEAAYRVFERNKL
jgi:hypothetical protein